MNSRENDMHLPFCEKRRNYSCVPAQEKFSLKKRKQVIFDLKNKQLQGKMVIFDWEKN